MQQRSQFQTLGCKNHPEDPASYHLLDQPWVKLCPQCALNIAVSGRKIGKQLSGSELENKTILTSITFEMRSTAELLECANKRMTEEVERAEKRAQQEIGREIRKFDGLVGELMRMRDGLWEMYEEKVLKKINGGVQKQSRLILNGMELKKTIEKIQTHFTDLVEGKNSPIPLKQQIEGWRSLNCQTRSIASSTDILSNFTQLKEEFYSKIHKSNAIISSYCYPQTQSEEKENYEAVMTEENSISMSKTCTKIAQLKLRSKSKNGGKKYPESMECSKKRKSIQDISNMGYRIGSFQL